QGAHIFQTERFPHRGEENGMSQSARFWGDKEKVEAYRERQSADLRARGTAREMQREAARQKMLNTAFTLLNAGCKIDTFEEYIAARKQHIGRIASIPGLLRKIETQFGSYDNFLAEVSANNHKVLWVNTLGEMDVYDVEVDCPTADDKSPESG